ncbi:MAG: hypothetical protein K5660_07650 [Paludibacteraceae bacterium]|nr:hypothetical protein [Paludibacteraceae bacterium]
MKTKLFFIAVCMMCAANMVAQSDDSDYLDRVMKELSKENCEGAQKWYDAYKEVSGQFKPSVQALIDDCRVEKQKKNEKKPKRDYMESSYCKANKNRYVAWNIAGAGYPWNLVTGIEFRGGGIVGVGLYGDIGMDFTQIEYTYKYGYNNNTGHDKTLKTAFRYAGGVRFYPYKGLFLDCGYGTIAKLSVDNISVPDSYSNDEQPNYAKKEVKNSRGILFHAGYNLVTDLKDGAGFFLGLSGGASYDVLNKIYAPSVNLKIGVAWGWQK